MDIRDIDDVTFQDLFSPCRGCIYWEYPDRYDKTGFEDSERLKSEWFSKMKETFDSCGEILYIDGKAVAYCQFAPPRYIANIKEYEKFIAPTDEDSVVITCLYVKEGYRGRGFGKSLLKYVIEEIRKRGFRIVETYARDDSSNNPSGPTRLYLDYGFEKVASGEWERAHFSLLRLSLK